MAWLTTLLSALYDERWLLLAIVGPDRVSDFNHICR